MLSFDHLEIENGDNNTNSRDKKNECNAYKEDYHIFFHCLIINSLSFPVNKYYINIHFSNLLIPFKVELYFANLIPVKRYRRQRRANEYQMVL